MGMAYAIDCEGHLDLSPCYKGMGCDMMLASEISHEYFFAELQDLVAWDGFLFAAWGRRRSGGILCVDTGKTGSR